MTLTDLSEFIPQIEKNAESNLSSSEKTLVNCQTLIWGNSLSPNIVKNAPYDLILVSDCIYKEELFIPLIDSIMALCLLGDGVAWIGHQIRRKADKLFWNIMKKRFFVNELCLPVHKGKLHLYECKLKN